MTEALQSLSGLIDFECSARLASFRLAATELDKTAAAVSQQIKQLERALGFALFVRHPRHIALTEKGRDFALTVARVLSELRAKAKALSDSDDAVVLRISATHSFSMKWLAPRLPEFSALHPTYDLRIEASDEPVALVEGICDVAIRYTQVQDDDEAPILLREHLVVAYSPALETGPEPLSLTELLRYPLLFEDSVDSWLQLLNTNGIRDRHYDFSHHYSHAGLLVQATMSGHGVGLLPYSLASDDIEHGRLKIHPCSPISSVDCYRMLYRRDPPGKVMHFVNWLREKATVMHPPRLEEGLPLASEGFVTMVLAPTAI